MRTYVLFLGSGTVVLLASGITVVAPDSWEPASAALAMAAGVTFVLAFISLVARGERGSAEPPSPMRDRTSAAPEHRTQFRPQDQDHRRAPARRGSAQQPRSLAEHQPALWAGFGGPGSMAALVALRSDGADALAAALVLVALLAFARMAIRLASGSDRDESDHSPASRH